MIDPDAAAWARLPWRERWREVAKYRYRTVDGHEVFQHVRWATRHPSGIDPQSERPKTFTYRHRNAHGASVVGLPDGLDDSVAHLIYQLPILAGVVAGRVKPKAGWAIEPTHPQGPGGAGLPPLVICEGEKDVESLADHGFVATTAHGGAMHGWGDAETRWLVEVGWTGDVWLAIDQDDAGWLHAAKALKALTSGLDVDIDVTCVVPREGKDASDALDASLGARWWERIDPPLVTARADRIERKLFGRAGGGGQTSRVNGYLTFADKAAWHRKQLEADLKREGLVRRTADE